MIYNNFRFFIWLCIIFGVGKTVILSKGLVNKPIRILFVWPLLVTAAILTNYISTFKGFADFNFKRDLEKISNTSDALINIWIVLLHSFNGRKIFNALYDTVDTTIHLLKLNDQALKLISIKMNVYVYLVLTAYVILIIGEINNISPPFTFLTRIPHCLTIIHLSLHLYLVLAILKILNQHMSELLLLNFKESSMYELPLTRVKICRYILDPDVKFISGHDQSYYFGFKNLCKIYDYLCTSMQLLQKIHGIHVLLSIWLMFSSAVVAVTLIACHQASPQWLVIAKAITPFTLCLLCCYLEDQLLKETEQTEIFIMKYIIDYRCDAQKRTILETFKQLICTNRLQFSACNLFGLNYTMLLGTIMNVITYSIIVIQLFLSA